MKVYKNKLGEYITTRSFVSNQGKTLYAVFAADNMSDETGWYRVKDRHIPVCGSSEECEKNLDLYARLRNYRYVFDNDF